MMLRNSSWSLARRDPRVLKVALYVDQARAAMTPAQVALAKAAGVTMVTLAEKRRMPTIAGRKSRMARGLGRSGAAGSRASQRGFGKGTARQAEPAPQSMFD